MAEQQGFESWAIVELMGHARIAGRVSEAEIGGGKLLRVDVPESKGRQPLTKYFGTAAVYALTPVDEETARMAAEEISVAPVNTWSARAWLKQQDDAKALPPSRTRGSSGEDDDDDYDDGRNSIEG